MRGSTNRHRRSERALTVTGLKLHRPGVFLSDVGSPNVAALRLLCSALRARLLGCVSCTLPLSFDVLSDTYIKSLPLAIL